jgi:hypothetical protein
VHCIRVEEDGETGLFLDWDVCLATSSDHNTEWTSIVGTGVTKFQTLIKSLGRYTVMWRFHKFKGNGANLQVYKCGKLYRKSLRDH